MTVEQWNNLRCHPSSRHASVRAIEVLVRRTVIGELQMTFRLDADIPRIRIPTAGELRMGEELWRHTCFELFIGVEGQPAYHEFNFAPSREWAVSAFYGYRNGGPLLCESIRPHIAVRAADGRLELDAVIRLAALSADHTSARLRLGLSAVIEAGDGFSYWALAHPRDKPDFHAAEGFTLLLEPPYDHR
jgi:hypothetical protein